MAARLYPHLYHRTGKEFWIVKCQECLVVLNSGHHYQADRPGDREHAEQLAAEHNAERHPPTIEDDIKAVLAAIDHLVPCSAWKLEPDEDAAIKRLAARVYS